MTVKSASARGSWLAAGCVLWIGAHSARAQESPSLESPLGLYVGAGAGASTLREEAGPDTGYYGLARENLGWDAFIGIRPLPFLGAEIGYTDFGTVHRNTYNFDPVSATYTGETFGHASAHAPTAFAVGYLPLGVPWFDVYGKLGAARLYKSWDFSPQPFCSGACPYDLPAPYAGSATEWDFAWGIGTQWKFGPLSLRLEYERVDVSRFVSGGDPDLLSVGLSWTLL